MDYYKISWLIVATGYTTKLKVLYQKQVVISSHLIVAIFYLVTQTYWPLLNLDNDKYLVLPFLAYNIIVLLTNRDKSIVIYVTLSILILKHLQYLL